MTNACLSEWFYSKPVFNAYEELEGSMKSVCIYKGIKHCGDYLKVTRLISHLQGVCAGCHLKVMNIMCWVGCSNWLWNRISSALHFLMWYWLWCHERFSLQRRRFSWCACSPCHVDIIIYIVSCSNRLETHSGLKLTWQKWFVVIQTNSLIWLTLWLCLWQREVKGCTKIYVQRGGSRETAVFVTSASVIILWKETEESNPAILTCNHFCSDNKIKNLLQYC